MRALCIATVSCFLSFGCSQPKDPKGIVAMTPSLSEAVWEIAPEKLIATSPYTTDPRAENLIRVQSTGSLETIVSLHPELVLLHSSDQALGDKLRTMGIATMTHDMDTIEDVRATVADLGKFLHLDDRAADIQKRLTSDLRENAARWHRENPTPILVIVDRLDMRMMQFYTAHAPTYIAELVSGCGFAPIAVGSRPWSRIEAEKLIQIDPPTIVFLARSREDADEVRKQFIQSYPQLHAVRSGRVLFYGNPDITVPGPEMGKRQRVLCEALEGVGKEKRK